MKLKELIGELQRLEKLNPDAEVHFQWVRNEGIRNIGSKAAFVDAVDIHGQLTIRITDPVSIEVVRRTPVE